ncbi:MAG: sodium:calcium antiporter [Candidatus Sungiibacteriota bacterium]|uniref:Sodium:calcium antiporter n=1 Tax=Candidatus Sungiibacteriota bacterium TaxID=2750080 RepID=A0A7T5RJF1_9BACT|nr:MAG: sodium:calcium antiporter [Candidatus Sungbacteria bacterium]
MSLVPIPWIALKIFGAEPSPILISLITGLTIFAAAFLLTWASEAAERDVTGSLIIALIALIAVLPEYAVDSTLAWSAGKDISFAPYAIANMTGANRLLIGIGWASLVFLSALKTKGHKTSVQIHPIQRLDCGILAIATLYAFTIPLKGFLAWFDGLLLGGLFIFYLVKILRFPRVELEIIGPAKAISEIEPKKCRVAVWVGLMAYAALAIAISAEPFAHSLITTGKALQIDEFILVQWLAPLASETPEFVIALLFAWRLKATKGLGVLVSSKINQWTLLIGTLPLVFWLSEKWHGSAGLTYFPLDARQSQEIFLTAAQSLFAVVLLANLSLSLKEAFALAILFCTQLVMPWSEARNVFTYIYLGLAVIVFLATPRTSLHSWRAVLRALKH